MKLTYQRPYSEIIRVENEGIMAASTPVGGSGLEDIGNGGEMFGTGQKSGNSTQSSGTLQDLEDLINDILTVK